MKGTFIDASFFLAILNDQDQWHRAAVAVSPGITGERVTSNLVAAEVLAIIGSRLGGKAAIRAWQYIDASTTLIFIDPIHWEPALERVLHFDGRVSMADATSIILMEIRGIERIASYDSDFDRVKGIERIH